MSDNISETASQMADNISETATTIWVDDTGEMDNTSTSWADEMEIESEIGPEGDGIRYSRPERIGVRPATYWVVGT
ncbi:hypothetical protein V1515DRAFT_579023 [Lipomyces mesembrius]